MKTIVTKCYWDQGLSRVPRRGRCRLGTSAVTLAREAPFWRKVKPFALHDLNKATGSNFSLCDDNYLIERSPTISPKGLCVAHYGLIWDGVPLLLWQKFVMESAAHWVISVKNIPVLRWGLLTFRLHSTTKLCVLLVQQKMWLKKINFHVTSQQP